MVDMFRLAGLLFLLTLLHVVVRGGRQPIREIMTGFALWILIFGATILIIQTPPVLVGTIIIGVAFGVVWFSSWLIPTILHPLKSFSAMPEPIGFSSLELLCLHVLGQSQAEAHATVHGLLKSHTPSTIARALVSYHAAGGATSTASEGSHDAEGADTVIAQLCEKETERFGALSKRVVEAVDCAAARAAHLLDALLSEYRFDSVERAISRLLASGPNRTRRHLLRELKAQGKPAEHKALLAEAAERAPTLGGAIRTLQKHMGGASLLIACLVPPYAYFFFRRPGRAVAFLAGYAALITYGSFLVSINDGGGWVYLAVAALAHMSALMSFYELYCESAASEE